MTASRSSRVTSALLDIEDLLAQANDDGAHPTAWTPALDDLHTVVIELAKLAAILQGHHTRWKSDNPAADRGEVAGAGHVADALSTAAELLREVARAIGIARNASPGTQHTRGRSVE